MTQYAIPYAIVAAGFLCYSLNNVQDDIIKPVAVGGSLLWPMWIVVAVFVVLCTIIITAIADALRSSHTPADRR